MPFGERKIAKKLGEKIFGKPESKQQKTAEEIKVQVSPERKDEEPIEKRILREIEGRSEKSERSVPERNAMIRKVAALLEEEKKDAIRKSQNEKEVIVGGRIEKGRVVGGMRMIPKSELYLEKITKVEKKFLKGNLDKEVINVVEDILFRKECALLSKEETALFSQKMEGRDMEKLDMEKLWEARKKLILETEKAERRSLIEKMKTTEVTKEEIAKVLAKKEGEKEKIEK